MKLVVKNSNYVNPITGKIIKNVFVIDGEFSDIPLLKKLKISFWFCQNYKKIDFKEENGELKPFETPKIKVLDSDTLVFTETSEAPTYVTLKDKTGTKTVELFKYLKSGKKLKGNEPIEIGYPTYQSVRTYFLKDNVGDNLVLQTKLDSIRKQLAKDFILKKWKLNGEPLGVQFKIEE